MQTDRIAVILLAAGQSTRFGSQKLQHRLPNGNTLLATTLTQYQAVFTNVTVVVNESTQTALAHGTTQANGSIKTVLSTTSEKNIINGMSQSLIAGVKSQASADAWLIALADMPYIKPNTLQRLAEPATAHNIVVPVIKHNDKQASQRGNPVIFGHDFKQDLLSLSGDVGAKQVINTHSQALVKVAVDDLGVLHDIDTPSDIKPFNKDRDF